MNWKTWMIADKSYKNMIDILLNQADAEDQFTNQEIADEVTTILFAVGMAYDHY